MIYLILSILSTVFVYVGLRYAGSKNMNPYHVILFNYISPFTLGLYLIGFDFIGLFQKPWILHALILGACIFIAIILLSESTKYLGVTVTSLAHKMSMIIPIIMGIFLYHESVSWLKIMGIFLALIGLLLTLYKPTQDALSKQHMWVLLFIFLIPGFNDTLIKYVDFFYLKNDMVHFVTAMYFFSLVLTIIYVVLRQRKPIKWETVLTGFLTGFPNFGGFYFFFLALAYMPDSGQVISLNNVGTIVVSVILAYLFYREKISALNWLGISLSVMAVYILTTL